MRLKLNAQLARYLEKRLRAPNPTAVTTSLPSYRARPWQVRDRLSRQDIADMIHSFKAGTAKYVLAKRYGMNLRSLKKLLREEGVRRKSWRDTQIEWTMPTLKSNIS